MRHVFQFGFFLLESLGFLFICGWHHKCCRFRCFWPRSSGSGPQPLSQFLTQFFSGNSAIIQVFWAFDWLLAFLVHKFWPKSDNFYEKSISSFCKNYGSFALTYETETLQGQSKVLKTQIVAYFPLNTWVIKLTLGVSAQGPVTWAKRPKTCSYLWPHLQKNPNPKHSILKIQTRRLIASFDGMNNSLA